MKVATWRGGDSFTIDHAPDPVPEHGQVLVKVDTVGICGSEVHMTQGLFPGEPPWVMGHEFTGVIVDTGPGIDQSIRGNGIAAIPTWTCGNCPGCRAGLRQSCKNAKRAHGMAEYAVMPAGNAIPIPDDLDLQTAALMEPSACCLSGLEMFQMPQNAVVLVMGAGVIGLMTAAFAKLRGAATVIVSEPISARRQIAANLGADRTIDPATDDLEGLIDDLTEGLGVHVACEAVGKPDLVKQAIRLTRPRGNVQLVGVNPQGSIMPADMFDVHYRELSIRGAFGGGRSFHRALDLLTQVPNVEKIITTAYPLREIAAAFADAADPAGVKVAIKPNQ